LVVFAVHFLGIVIGFQHPSVKPKLKVKTKVVVQTVDLRSRPDVGVQLAKPAPAPSPPLPKSERKEKDEKVVAARETLPVESTPPKPSPLSAKVEQKKAVKAEVKASPAAESKAPPVVKRTVAPVNPTTVKANAKPKEVDQPQKKAIDSKAEVEKAEKKKQQEKAEAEKVDRKRAEEEKEKQERLAVALGALGKSKLSRENMNHQPKRASLAQVADPKAIGSLEIDVWMSDQGEKGEAWGVQEVNYRDQVGETLRSELKLPEYGAVTIRLTLGHLGKVINVEIVNSQSGKNRAYVEKTLPMLSFPPFGQQFKGELQCTFSFILKNNS
jgi:hypothetical protein